MDTWADAWADRLGARRESVEYRRRVLAWRDLWRPPRVRVLIVAESHLAELEGDLDVHVELPPALTVPKVPAPYCRSVQCLGWGEPDLQRREGVSSTWEDDTNGWQYWRLLGACAHRDATARMPTRAASSLADRLAWKVGVLDALRARGVWLVDASIVGIKVPRGQRVAAGSAYLRLVRESYERFVWPVVADDPPEQVWTIGKRTTAVALAGMPGVRPDRALVQPRHQNAFTDDLVRLVAHLP